MMAMPLAAAHMPQAYREWNALLADELFPPGRAGVPVYLAVHDGLLAECGARRAYGGRDEFVRAVLGLSTPARLFVSLDQLAEVWSENGRGGEPPIIAGLALAVLAAGDMATDENAPQHNYYVRLNTLLGTPQNQGKPEGFERTPDLWRLLQDWLRRERRGELIVHGLDSDQRPFVGPVESQCLVRSCDLSEVLPVLRTSEHAPGQLPDPDEILPALRAWLLGPGSSSRLARLLRRDPDDTALRQAAEALCDAIENSAPEQPLAIAAVRAAQDQPATLAIRTNPHPNLMWKRAKWLLRLSAAAEADEPECLMLVGDDVVVARLDVREPASYDAEITHEQALGVLRGQTRVRDEDEADVTPPKRALAWFHDGALRGRRGSWNLVDAPQAGIEHAVVFLGDESLAELQPALERPAVLLAGDAAVWPGPNTSGAYAAVPRASAVLPGNIPVRTSAPLLRLHGGLRLRRGLYLRGGLPSPVASESAMVSAEETGAAGEPAICAAAEFPSLDLREGRYAVHCEGAAAEIAVVEPRWRECIPARAPALDHHVRTALRGAILRGAHITAPEPEYAEYFPPGTQYRLYAPNVVKGVAPVGGGIHEHRTAHPVRQITFMKRERAAAPLAKADCFAEEASDDRVAPATAQRAALNRLLEYVSARGTGSVDSVRSYCAGIAPDDAWHRALTTLEELGHIDISWDEGRKWTAAPALAFPRAADPRVSIFCGTRAREILEWLNQRGIPAHADESCGAPGRSPMPDCVVAPTDTILHAGETLLEAGVRWLQEAPSMQMALHVRSLTEKDWWLGPQFSPPLARIQQTLQRWDSVLLRWNRASDLERDGLYYWQQHGRRLYYLAASGAGARVLDPAAAKWFLAPPDRSYLLYEGTAQRLLVPAALDLPRIWKRICSLASGLMPARRSRLLVYNDIPINLARAAAVRLNQSRMEGIL